MFKLDLTFYDEMCEDANGIYEEFASLEEAKEELERLQKDLGEDFCYATIWDGKNIVYKT